MTAVAPLVGVVMGSATDLETMRPAGDALAELEVAHELRVVSAHRTPDAMLAYGREAETRGLRVIVAGAGGAAHLPGMLAAVTVLPVVGVPVASTTLSGWDSLLSIAQMPAGVPVATVAVGNGRNGGLLAARILATGADAPAGLRDRLRAVADAGRAKAEAQDASLTIERSPPS